jgi:hypothetical protein
MERRMLNKDAPGTQKKIRRKWGPEQTAADKRLACVRQLRLARCAANVDLAAITTAVKVIFSFRDGVKTKTTTQLSPQRLIGCHLVRSSTQR